MRFPRTSPAASYIDVDGVPVPVDLDGNPIPEDPPAAPPPEAAPTPSAEPDHEPKRGRK